MKPSDQLEARMKRVTPPTVAAKRKHAAKRAMELLAEHDGACSHFGIVGIRQLLDYIYGKPPARKDEEVTRDGVSVIQRAHERR